MGYDNAASRLHGLLREAKAIPQDKPVARAWKELFGTSDPVALLERQALMMALVPQVVAQLEEAFPESVSAWTSWTAPVLNAFNGVNSQQSWVGFLQHYDENVLVQLDMAAHLLDSKQKTKILSAAEIEGHRQVLDDLLTEVLNADYSAELKKYLARSLRKIIGALDEYKISGGTAVLDAIDAAIGRAMLDEGLGDEVRSSPLAEKVFTAIAAIANTVTITTGAVQLSSPLMKLLGA